MRQQKQNNTININVDASFFNEAFRPLMLTDKRYVLLMGGGASGKSYFAVQRMILKAMESNRRVLVVRKVAATLRASIFELFIQQLSEMKLLPLCKVTTSNLKIEFPNGSQFIFMGLDDPEKIKSITGIDDILIEECTELTLEDYTQLQLRLRSNKKNPQIWMMMNPVSTSNWTYKHFFEEEQPDTLIHHSTYKDNIKNLTPDFVQTMESYKTINPNYYQIYVLGKWGSLGKTVFTNWKVEEFELDKLIKANPKLETAIGADFGFINDPSTLSCSLVDLDNRKLYIFDELYEKGLLNDEFAQHIIDKGYGRQLILADSAEKKSIEEIRQYGVTRIKPARKGAGSVNAGIGFLQQFEIIIHPKCKHTITEFENYSYKKDKQTGQYLNQPIDSFNHIIDALRYSMETYNGNKNKAQALPLSWLGL
ncbi:PBSX family phage terminase large subunit [Sporosarcina saromensis]|uniref:PBSX family phage terminase large subunit n=1 Tax=Sporosarcina saromensis TaxID=359365 RepID=A0ABU4G5D0_9BACL|nr:PBSX family phage terminase large subunit [Sporosarcina saromensis]MDW0112167.1 PBSX family phage terminase large subunit [Sporosarcina saromensis]